MDSVEPTTSATPTPPTSTPQPTTDPTPSPPPPPQPQSQPPPQTLPPPSPELPQNPNPNPTQNPTTPPPQPQSSTPLPTSQHSQTPTPTPTPTPRPHPPLTRPRPPQSYPQYAQPHLTTSSSSTPLPSPSTTSTPLPRAGGLALGVPAHQPRPSQPTSFSSFGPSSYSQQFVGLGRNPVSVGDSSANQVKQPITGVQTTIGSMGSLSFGAQSRQPAGLQQQQRAVHPSMRPQATPSNQSMPNQRPGLSRAQSLGSPSPGTPIGLQQPWGPSGPQGKQMQPPLPSSSGRQQKPQSLQQRSHLPPQHPHSLPTSSHPQMASAQQQQQSSQMHQSQEHFGQQQYPPPRAQQLNQQQQQAPRGPGSGPGPGPGNQKTPAVATGQSGMIQSGTASLDAGESGKNIVGKRCIHELVSQVDPTEKLDPEVEDILIEMAEDFVDSITTFGCSLAKHRKSVTLEAKDILLHLERNWHMTLPGFGGDEIKNFKKQCTTDIHKERLAAVKKSVVGLDAANTKSFAGQTPGNAKGHAAKAPPAPGSPKGA